MQWNLCKENSIHTRLGASKDGMIILGDKKYLWPDLNLLPCEHAVPKS